MTALYMDGFNHYGTDVSKMLDGAWAQVNGKLGVPVFGARTGAFAFGSVTNSIGGRFVLRATETEVFLSMGLGAEELPPFNNRQQVVSFKNASNIRIATLYLQSTGVLALLGNDDTTVLAQTQGPVIVAGNWHFLEMDFDQAGGNFTLRVDDASASDTPAITATGLSLGSDDIAQLEFLTVTSLSLAQVWMADLLLRNTDGSVNNSWLGDRRIATLLVDADTPTMGWIPRYYQKIGVGILNVTGNFFGTGACVGATSNTSLNVGAGDFTIENFVRLKSLPTGSNKAVIFGKWDETHDTRSYQLFLGSQALNSGSLCFQTSTDGSVSTVAQPIVYPWAPELDTWYHVAVVRASGELLLFVDGQQLGLPIADSNTYFAGGAPLGIAGQVEKDGGGGFVQTANSMVVGWLDETRFTIGFARYTTNFTPTTVAFPRGTDDPEWADVALMCGYDSLIQDESGFSRNLLAFNNAAQQMVDDGPAVGVWSTLGKAAPDDNTFAEAPFLPATSILTLAAQPAVNNTVTVGTKDGTTPAVYTFKSVLTGAFQVLIDTSLQQTMQNLYNAINAGTGSGTKYGTGTTSNNDVVASQLPAGQMAVTSLTPGTAGNSIATTATLTNGGGWTGATLAGGVNIPGPSDFKVQRPPPNTTIISAVQIVARAFKSDAGVGSINTAFIGPLGAVTTGPTHALTVSPVYYNDIYEEDPDTSAPISPATLINGSIRLNRVS